MKFLVNLIKIILLFFGNICSRIGRFIYWYLRLSQSRIGKNVKFEFPVIVEGSGTLQIDDNCKIEKRVSFGRSPGSSIKIGKGSKIYEKVNIHAGENTSIKIGENCAILTNSILRNGNEVDIGNRSSISSYCQIFPREEGYDGKLIMGEKSNIGDNTMIDTSNDVIIGNEVAIGPYDIIYTHDHDYKSTSFAAWKGGVITGQVIVKDGAWVGARVTLLPGVTIGKRAIVAAGSVVTKNVEDGDIVAGVPAKSLLKNKVKKAEAEVKVEVKRN